MVKFYMYVPKYFLEIIYSPYPISAYIVSLNDDESIFIILLFLLRFSMI